MMNDGLPGAVSGKEPNKGPIMSPGCGQPIGELAKKRNAKRLAKGYPAESGPHESEGPGQQND